MILFSYLKQHGIEHLENPKKGVSIDAFNYLLSMGWGSFYGMRGKRRRRWAVIKHINSKRWRR